MTKQEVKNLIKSLIDILDLKAELASEGNSGEFSSIKNEAMLFLEMQKAVESLKIHLKNISSYNVRIKCDVNEYHKHKEHVYSIWIDDEVIDGEFLLLVEPDWHYINRMDKRYFCNDFKKIIRGEIKNESYRAK